MNSWDILLHLLISRVAALLAPPRAAGQSNEVVLVALAATEEELTALTQVRVVVPAGDSGLARSYLLRLETRVVLHFLEGVL